MSNKMSSDRVRFYWNTEYSPASKPETPTLFARAFGIPEYKYRDLCRSNEKGFWVICRPSQFARFLIWRNDLGICNSFKALVPELIEGVPCGDTIEVWKNPVAHNA